MEEFKGTRGPWNYCADEPEWVTDSNDNIAVARVTRYNTDANAQHANAKLIAAAPELPEALQRCESVLSNIPLEVSDVEDLLYARAAINKALGEQK